MAPKCHFIFNFTLTPCKRIQMPVTICLSREVLHLLHLQKKQADELLHKNISTDAQTNIAHCTDHVRSIKTNKNVKGGQTGFSQRVVCPCLT